MSHLNLSGVMQGEGEREGDVTCKEEHISERGIWKGGGRRNQGNAPVQMAGMPNFECNGYSTSIYCKHF